MDVKVLSLNCWAIKYLSRHRQQRIESIGSAIYEGDYDFVFLQEIWSVVDFNKIRSRVQSKLPYSHYFHSGVIGSGLCILSKSPIIDSFYHQWLLNGYIHRFQHGDWFCGKGVGICRVFHHGLIINLVITHLHAQYHCDKQDEYKAHRLSQAFDTAQLVKLIAPSGDLTILGGDLNSEPQSISFSLLCAISGLKDAFTMCETNKNSEEYCTSETPQNYYTSKASLKEAPYGKRIDYILYSTQNMIQVSEYYITSKPIAHIFKD